MFSVKMVRKRKGVPQKADEAKRQAMAWNMAEQEAAPDPIMDPHDDNEQSVAAIPSKAEHSNVQNAVKEPNMLENCSFFLTIHRDKPKKGWYCELGEFDIIGLPTCLPPSVNSCYLYIDQETSRHIFYYQVDECQSQENTDIYQPVTATIPNDFMDGLHLSQFWLRLKWDNVRDEKLRVIVCLVKAGLTKLTFSSESCSQRKVNVAIMQLLQHFYGIKAPGEFLSIILPYLAG